MSVDWSMTFTFDAQLGIVDARFKNVVLNTNSDAEKWEQEVRKLLVGYGQKVDLLICLDGLKVTPAANRRFGELRSQLLSEFAHSSYRYGGDGWTQSSINTSSVLLDADANLFQTKGEALRALLVARRERKNTP